MLHQIVCNLEQNKNLKQQNILYFSVDCCSFFFGTAGLHNNESHPRCTKRERKTVSDFYRLKTLPAPSITPGVHGISFERYPRPRQRPFFKEPFLSSAFF